MQKVGRLLAGSRVESNSVMGGKNNYLKSLDVIARVLRDSEVLKTGQARAADKALRKIRRGYQRENLKLVKEGVAELARTLIREN